MDVEIFVSGCNEYRFPLKRTRLTVLSLGYVSEKKETKMGERETTTNPS